MSGGAPPAGRARRRRLALAGGVAAAVLVADQVTKHLAVEHLSQAPVHLAGPLSLVLEYNSGVAFSLGSGSTWPAVLALVALGGVFVWLVRSARTTLAAAAFGLVLGGALGNLSDRILGGHDGAVVDFVHVGVWPVFNLADASVVVGSVLLAVGLLRSRRRPETDEPDEPAVPAAADAKGSDGATASDVMAGADEAASSPEAAPRGAAWR